VKFYCIGDEDTVRGFRLAGIEGQVVVSPEEAAAALRAWRAAPTWESSSSPTPWRPIFATR